MLFILQKNLTPTSNHNFTIDQKTQILNILFLMVDLVTDIDKE